MDPTLAFLFCDAGETSMNWNVHYCMSSPKTQLCTIQGRGKRQQHALHARRFGVSVAPPESTHAPCTSLKERVQDVVQEKCRKKKSGRPIAICILPTAVCTLFWEREMYCNKTLQRRALLAYSGRLRRCAGARAVVIFRKIMSAAGCCGPRDVSSYFFLSGATDHQPYSVESTIDYLYLPLMGYQT